MRWKMSDDLKMRAAEYYAAHYPTNSPKCIVADFARQETARLRKEREALRKALYLISIVDQGCGGTLTYEEMAKSAMRQARQALSNTEEGGG
jgi:hypothetical protein